MVRFALVTMKMFCTKFNLMNILEVNYKPTLEPQFNKKGRRRHKYKFIDCTEAVESLDVLGSVEWHEWLQRVAFTAATMKIDVLATPVDFNKDELAEILGKKGILLPLEK